MNKCIFLFFSLLLTNASLFSQTEQIANDTLQIETKSDSLVSDSITTEMPKTLLPSKYPLTQRLLWSEKGLMRHFDYFELTETGRDREMEIRNTMLTAHRYAGYATLAGMIAQGFVGQKLYNGDKSMKGLHEGLAGVVNFGYFTTAGLALFAPPRMQDRAKGFSMVKLHKYLAIVHLSTMVATNILSGMTEDNPSLVPYHRAVAYTAFGSFFASMVIIHF